MSLTTQIGRSAFLTTFLIPNWLKKITLTQINMKLQKTWRVFLENRPFEKLVEKSK
jgi:hypothetical protein